MSDLALALNKLYFHMNVNFFITRDYFSLLLKTLDTAFENE